MPLEFPSFIWKALVGGSFEGDLEGFDHDAQVRLRRIQGISEQHNQAEPYKQEILSEIGANLFWATKLSDGTSADLHTGGRIEPVTTAGMLIYARRSLECRMHESEHAMLAMRNGVQLDQIYNFRSLTLQVSYP